jgi:hypothetical protein
MHGTELYCSYFACRNAGIKFRYCVYCKLPVAKRNFAKRHRHTGKISVTDLPRDFEESSEGDDLSSSELGSAGMKSPNLGMSSAAHPAVKSDPQNPVQWEAQDLLDMLLARNVQELQTDGSTGTSSNKTPIGSEVLEQLIQKKQGDWDKLLMERPRTSKDPSAMATWLLEVLRVSDVDKTTAAVVSAAANIAPPTSSSRKVNSKPKAGLKKKKRKLIHSAAKPSKDEKPKKKKGETTPKTKPKQDETSSASESKPPAAVEQNGKSKPVQDKEEEGNDDTDLEEEEIHKSQDDIPAATDDSSTSSEDSVDLRASKKART